jgi:RNA polymerase sigma-70 factor, ECF subfamily
MATSVADTDLQALAVAAFAGDRDSYRALLDRLARHLRAFFARRLGSGAGDVEDLVQETLLAVHLKRETYDPSLPFAPWAYGVARYKLLDHFRRTGARRSVALEDAGDLLSDASAEEGAVRADVDRLLARLPARQQRLLRAVKIAGHSFEEAAAQEGMSVTAAKVAVHRSMKKLESEVGDENP